MYIERSVVWEHKLILGQIREATHLYPEQKTSRLSMLTHYLQPTTSWEQWRSCSQNHCHMSEFHHMGKEVGSSFTTFENCFNQHLYFNYPRFSPPSPFIRSQISIANTFSSPLDMLPSLFLFKQLPYSRFPPAMPSTRACGFHEYPDPSNSCLPM